MPAELCFGFGFFGLGSAFNGFDDAGSIRLIVLVEAKMDPLQLE